MSEEQETASIPTKEESKEEVFDQLEPSSTTEVVGPETTTEDPVTETPAETEQTPEDQSGESQHVPEDKQDVEGGDGAAETETSEEKQEGGPSLIEVEVTGEDGEKAAEGTDESKAGGGDEKGPDGEEGAEGETGEAGGEGKVDEEVETAGEQPESTEAEEGEPKPEVEEHQEVKPEGEDDKPTSPIPQSDTFQEGERAETPTVQVAQPLSREGSPTQEPGRLEAGTPERQCSPEPEDDIMEEEEEEALYSREELVDAYQAAIAEREQLQNHNLQLQHKLAEYFKKKKSDDQRQEMDKNVTDQEQRYLKYMSNLEDLRIKEQEERESFQIQLEELRDRKQEKLETVMVEDGSFKELKTQVALEAISSRTGKPLAPRDVEHLILNEEKKEEEVKVVRLENIKLKNRLKKREQQLKAKEELAEGLHLIDFEQLKIENQTYNEKIEERNEELLKLRKKITSTVQVLTHVKEKLQFVQAENQVQKSSLKEVEALVAQKRDILSRTKKARDSLRIDNQRLRQKCGLLGNTALLRDFEERKDEGDKLRERLEKLKRMHAELTLNTAGVKKKIEEARSGRA